MPEVPIGARSLGRILNAFPPEVVQDVTERGGPAFNAYLAEVLTWAPDQPLPYDALGYVPKLCACGQIVWGRGTSAVEMMTGVKHDHAPLATDLTYEEMAAAWDREPAPAKPRPTPWQSRYGGELT